MTQITGQESGQDAGRAARIEAALRSSFAPQRLRVIDESALHRGHAGAPEGGESHFRVEMAAAKFAGLSRIERHRQVHSALGAELMGEIHALALSLSE